MSHWSVTSATPSGPLRLPSGAPLVTQTLLLPPCQYHSCSSHCKLLFGSLGNVNISRDVWEVGWPNGLWGSWPRADDVLQALGRLCFGGESATKLSFVQAAEPKSPRGERRLYLLPTLRFACMFICKYPRNLVESGPDLNHAPEGEKKKKTPYSLAHRLALSCKPSSDEPFVLWPWVVTMRPSRLSWAGIIDR